MDIIDTSLYYYASNKNPYRSTRGYRMQYINCGLW
jgi:hypothetical protein